MAFPRLSRSRIEYLDYSWGVYSGCKNDSSICAIRDRCWARVLANRFKSHYPKGFEPTWYPEAVMSPLSVKKPSIIGVGWVGDLFGDWVNPEMTVPISLYGELSKKQIIDLCKASLNPMPGFSLKEAIYTTISCCPQHQFLFLTKCWWNLKKWDPFPKNAWVGVTVTDGSKFPGVLYALADLKAGLKWLSVEPMLGPVVPKVWPAEWDEIGWVAIGAATRPYRPPKTEWVEDLVIECVKTVKPVFLKANLVDALPATVPFYVPPRYSQNELVVLRDAPGRGKIEMVYRQEIPNWR